MARPLPFPTSTTEPAPRTRLSCPLTLTEYCFPEQDFLRVHFLQEHGGRYGKKKDEIVMKCQLGVYLSRSWFECSAIRSIESHAIRYALQIALANANVSFFCRFRSFERSAANASCIFCIPRIFRVRAYNSGQIWKINACWLLPHLPRAVLL